MQHDPVRLDEVVVLPRARVARVDAYSLFVSKLRVRRRDEDRALDVLERRGPARLLLTVVGRQDFAARVRDFRRRVRINLGGLDARARIPRDGLAAAHVHNAVRSGVRHRGRLAVAILLDELRIAVGVNAFKRGSLGREERGHLLRGECALALDKLRVARRLEALNVLRLSHEQRGHILRSERARPAPGRLLQGLDDRASAARRVEVAREISDLVEPAAEGGRIDVLAVGSRIGLRGLDQKLRVAVGLGAFEVAPRLAPEEVNVVRGQTLVGGLRVSCLRLGRGERHDWTAARAHLLQDAALVLHAEVEVCGRGRDELRLGVGVERAAVDVLARLRRLKLLIVVEVEVELRREDFGRVPRTQRAQIGVAARDYVLDVLLLVEYAAEGVAAHHVRPLLRDRPAREVYVHRYLVELGLRRLDRDGLAAMQVHLGHARVLRLLLLLLLLLPAAGLDRYLDRTFQHELLNLRFEGAGVRAAVYVLALEVDGRGDVGGLLLQVVLDRLGLDDQLVVRLYLDRAGKEELRVVLVRQGLARAYLVGAVALVGIDFEVDVHKLVMAVGELQIAVGLQDDPEAVALHLAVFEIRYVADDFRGELRLSGPQAELRVVLQTPVGDDDRGHAARQKQQRQHAHELRSRDTQPDARHPSLTNLLHVLKKLLAVSC